MTFFKSTSGLTGALECKERYRLGVLVEKDEEDGLSPSFWTYAFYISYLLHARVSTRANSRASEYLSAHGEIILSALFCMDSILSDR